MFGLSTIQLSIIGALVGVILAMGAGLALQNWSHSRTIAEKDNQINSLNSEIAAEKVAHAATQTALDQTQISFEVMQRQNRILERNFNAAERGRKKLQDILDKRDLEELAIKKPGLIENRVNRGTDRVFEELEDITNPETYFEEDTSPAP